MSTASRNSSNDPSDDVAVGAVESLTHDARGVARIRGKTTFIEGALPGEQVRFRYRRKHSRYDSGIAIEILRANADRVAPACRYYGTCGGCTLQHLAPPAQVSAKQRLLAETLERIGRVQPLAWSAPIEGPTQAYRRRARLGVRFVPSKGGVLVGFRERRQSYIAPLDDCLTLDARLARLLTPLREIVGSLSRPDRLPQIELAAGDDACAAVFRHLDRLTDTDLVRLREFSEAHRLAVYLQPDRSETIEPFWPVPAPVLRYALPDFGLQLAFGPNEFVQANAEVNRALVGRAVEWLDLSATDVVADLFCGVGNFTLAAARRAARVLGFEADRALVERGRANAGANGVANVEFHTADLYDSDVVARLFSGLKADKLLLDPPRAGAMDVIKAIPASGGPRRIVYVSCDPATLARDSQYLVHVLGYRLELAGIADMFPHTSHIESIALYTRP